MGCISTAAPKGIVFKRFWSGNWSRFRPFWSEIGYAFFSGMALSILFTRNSFLAASFEIGYAFNPWHGVVYFVYKELFFVGVSTPGMALSILFTRNSFLSASSEIGYAFNPWHGIVYFIYKELFFFRIKYTKFVTLLKCVPKLEALLVAAVIYIRPAC